MKHITFLLLLLGSFVYVLPAQAQDRKIEFEKGSWSDIMAKAQQENKLVFLDAYASWCGPCKWMSANVFTVNEVADFFNTHFVCAKIDMEKGEGVELAKKYRVQAYPTLLFINGQGDVAHRVVGSMPDAMLVEKGLQALNPYENLLAYQERFEEGERDSKFMKEYLEVLGEAGTPTGEAFDAYFANLSEEERQTADMFEMIDAHVQNKEAAAAVYFLENRDAYMKVADENRVATKISNLYMQAMAQAAQEKDEETYATIRKEALSLEVEGMDAGVVMIDMRKAMFNKDWKEAAKAGDKLFGEYETEDGQMMNQIAWNFYEATDNKKALKSALSWAKRSIELNSEANNNDTAAALLYKLGEYEEAKEYAETAVKLAKESGAQVEGFQDMLDKINKAMKKS